MPLGRHLHAFPSACLWAQRKIFCAAFNGLEHRRTRVRTPKTNGFVERFNGTVLEKFFRINMHENFYNSVDAEQSDSITGLSPTGLSGRISATGTWAAYRLKPSCYSSGKKVKRIDHTLLADDMGIGPQAHLYCRKDWRWRCRGDETKGGSIRTGRYWLQAQ